MGFEPRHVCSLKYRPVDEDWRHRMCQFLGLQYHGPNGITSGGPEVCLTVPAIIKSICGDGNCFYCAIAYVITGSQRQHLAVHQAIVDHMRSMGDQLTEDLSGGIGIEQYIADNFVECSGSWATETEMYAASHLLRMSLFTYTRSYGEWLQLHPRLQDTALATSDVSEVAIYLHNPGNHYEVGSTVCCAL